jgi:outer membrane assembly lipoprotein YfiO
MQNFQKLIFIVLLFSLIPSCKKDDWKNKQTYYQSKHQPLKSDQEKPTKPSVMNKNPKSLSFDDLKVAKKYSEDMGNKRQTIMYLELMVKLCSDPNTLKEIYLELADLYFEQGNMELASKLYTSYITLYPGSPQRAYVHYQAILCKFYSTFSSDRDQTRTEEAFLSTQMYLQLAIRDELYREYRDDVTAIQKQCCKKMYDHEMDIFNFYYKKGNYKAAQVHLEEIKKIYITLMRDEVEPDLLTLECDLAKQLGDTTTLVAKQAELQAKYPQTASIKLAANTTHKTDHVARF